MITCLEVENYRGFPKYRMAGMSRVNLLVGRNNSGKTCLLEAVELLASRGGLQVVERIARQRGELIYEMSESDARRPYIDISHFFCGHDFDLGSSFRVCPSRSIGGLVFEIIGRSQIPERTPLTGFDTDPTLASHFLEVHLTGHKPSVRVTLAILPVSENGAIPTMVGGRSSYERVRRSNLNPVRFLTQDSPERGSLGQMWDLVSTEGRERDVVEALRILEPRLSSVVFLSGGERPFRFEPRSGILLGFEGSQRRSPLGSHGEGMRRLLALALALVTTQDGVLLIDEVDTGLHYSIMGDLWLLIVEAARRNGVQVFLTTHSLDCVRGLAWLCANHPHLGSEVSLQKIVPELEEAVALDAEQIRIAYDQEIEVR